MGKWKILIGVCLLALLSVQSKAQTFNFKIYGKLNNISPIPEKMYLTALVKGTLQKNIDTADVINGQYCFKGQLNVDEAVSVTIATDSRKYYGSRYNLYLDKGELNIVSDGEVKNITVTGTGAAAQLEHELLVKGTNKEKIEIEQIEKEKAFTTADHQFRDSVFKKYYEVEKRQSNILFDFVKDYPRKRSAPITAYLLMTASGTSAGRKDTIIKSLPRQVKKDRLGREIIHTVVQRDSFFNNFFHDEVANMPVTLSSAVSIGSKAPDFTQADVHNKPVSLSSFKGKYVLVDFWASWCLPCRAANPYVVKAYHKYKAKGFTVLGVSLDMENTRTDWLKAIVHDSLAWKQVSDLKGWKNEVAKIYGVTGIPQNFLVDPSGVVIAEGINGEKLDVKLKEIFKTN